LKLATTLVLPITLITLVCVIFNFNPFLCGWEWVKGFGEMPKSATSQDIILWVALSGITLFAISKQIDVNLFNAFWVAFCVSAILNLALMVIASFSETDILFLHLVFIAGLSAMFVLVGHKWNSAEEGIMGVPVILAVTILALKGTAAGIFSLLAMLVLAMLTIFACRGVKKYITYLKK